MNNANPNASNFKIELGQSRDWAPAIYAAQDILSQNPFSPAAFRSWIVSNISVIRLRTRLPSPSQDDKIQREIFEFLDAGTEKSNVKDKNGAIQLVNDVDAWIRRNSSGASKGERVNMDRERKAEEYMQRRREKGGPDREGREKRNGAAERRIEKRKENKGMTAEEKLLDKDDGLTDIEDDLP